MIYIPGDSKWGELAVSFRGELAVSFREGSTRHLVGGWTNPFEKYATVKLDHETPGIGVKIKNIWVATT